MQLSQRSARLKAPGGQHDSRSIHALSLSTFLHHNAHDGSIFADELPRGRLEPHLDARALKGGAMRGDEALTAIARAECQAAPELMPPVIQRIRLPVEREREWHTDGTPQPFDGRPRPLDHRAHEQPRIAPAAAEAHDVVRELLGRVRLDIDERREPRRDVLDEREEVRQAPVDGSVCASGEEAVAACPGLGAFVEDKQALATVLCG